MQKTFSAKPSLIKRNWYIIDASETTLGRISTVSARLLLGKDKPMVTAHIDTGDYVIIINSDNLKVTGNKLNSIKYYSHSQHPGALKTRTLSQQLERDSRKVIIHAVRGMLPNNKLLDNRLNRLKVYTGSEHNHAPQKPELLNLTKNKEK